MKKFLTKVAVTTAVATAATGVGLAFALWTAGGSGSGQAKSVTAQTLTVSAGTATADLYPGSTGGDLYLSIANPNPYAVTVTGVTGGTVTSSDTTNCPSSNVTVGSKTGLSIAVPAGATAQAATVSDIVSMLSTAPDGCQGKTFTITVDLTGTQASS